MNAVLTIEAWNRAYDRFRVSVKDIEFAHWFGRLAVERIEGQTIELSFPTRFLSRWVSERYGARISALLDMECPGVRIDFTTREFRPVDHGASIPVPHRVAEPNHIEPADEPASVTPFAVVALDSPRDPRFAFGSFLIGAPNRLAQAAARTVAQSSGRPAYSPLYIYGAVGLGKTHLLQAIVEEGEGQGRRVAYLSAERFMLGFTAAVRGQALTAFREHVRQADALVIDDLQHMNGANVLREFGFTLNALIDAGRQIVVAADRPPSELDALDGRMRSRLAGGLVVEIEAFDHDLRLAVLASRMAVFAHLHPGFSVPPDVLAFIASNCGQNGRQLDGALNRLLAHNQLAGRTVTMALAEVALHDLVRTIDPKRVRVDDILSVVAKHYNVTRADILSQRRTAVVVKPRQVAMYLSKTLTPRSLPEIGRRFGGRDHTTVLHAVRKIEGLRAGDTQLDGEVIALSAILTEGARA